MRTILSATILRCFFIDLCFIAFSFFTRASPLCARARVFYRYSFSINYSGVQWLYWFIVSLIECAIIVIAHVIRILPHHHNDRYSIWSSYGASLSIESIYQHLFVVSSMLMTDLFLYCNSIWWVIPLCN